MELIDPSIADSCPQNQVFQCIHMAMLCLQESAMHRPTMSDVLLMLESENTTSFPSPMLPNIPVKGYVDMDPSHDITSSNDLTFPSDYTMFSNDVTVTEVDVR